ncbi:unnamed protein product, partial [Mesorhabditis belari]|uniref:Tc1-like transposase DDE domain-containing protein n=1 Tax=Mesorhabditis belari TaxID=2138241 RepID=A0AAF3EKY0_9BILA
MRLELCLTITRNTKEEEDEDEEEEEDEEEDGDEEEVASKQVPLLDWPACSPDLNPIENLWGMLARRVYHNSTQYANVQALKDAIIREWNAIPRSTIKKLVDSMPSRIFDVISRQGQATKY